MACRFCGRPRVVRHVPVNPYYATVTRAVGFNKFDRYPARTKGEPPDFP